MTLMAGMKFHCDKSEPVGVTPGYRAGIGKANCTYADQSLPVGANVGYCFVGPKDTVEGLMSRADAAMYRAKEKAG